MKNKNFIKSLSHALCGIKDACREERNLRFHFAAGVMVCVFAAFYGLNKTEWAVLILTISAVITAELFNTGIERAVDTATDEIKESAKLAKDSAAAAVLCSAIGAAAVGVCLFGDIKKITYTLINIFTDVQNSIFFAAVLAVCIGFLAFAGKRRK